MIRSTRIQNWLSFIKIFVVLEKKTELEVLLCSELKHVDVICLTEHWQSYQKLSCTNVVDFKLVSAFCKSSSEHGGSGISELKK
jgi:hypothetical protein